MKAHNARQKGNGNEHSPWTPEDDEYLRENWNSLSPTKLARTLQRTESAITTHAGELGLFDTKKMDRMEQKHFAAIMAVRHPSAEEIKEQYLDALGREYSVEKIAEKLDEARRLAEVMGIGSESEPLSRTPEVYRISVIAKDIRLYMNKAAAVFFTAFGVRVKLPEKEYGNFAKQLTDASRAMIVSRSYSGVDGLVVEYGDMIVFPDGQMDLTGTTLEIS